MSVDSLHYERRLWMSGHSHVAGIDEAGRGCLAGPVVAAAAIFPVEMIIPGVNDSKQVAPGLREELFEIITQKAIAWAIGICSPVEIDRLNILHASLEAMKRAVAKLAVEPSFLLIDGNRAFPDATIPLETVVKGDEKSQSIAAASILAKVSRDRLMVEFDEHFPGYGFSKHKGYPTKQHFSAIERLGPTKIHRTTFRLKPKEKQLDLF